jgi:hypothetical protein
MLLVLEQHSGVFDVESNVTFLTVMLEFTVSIRLVGQICIVAWVWG